MPKSRARSGVLFLQEAATRNGSPLALLHILRWLKANSGRPSSLLFSYHGDLLEEFAGVASVRTAESSRWCPGGIRSQALRLAGLGPWARRNEAADLRKFANGCRPAVIYANSFAKSNFQLIEMLKINVPVITHVHEMEFLLRMQSGSATIMKALIDRTHQFIAASDAVKDNLVQNHGVSPNKIETVHEYIPVAQIRAERSRSEIRSELRLPQDAVVVAACGWPGSIKGTDLFLQLARVIRESRPNVFFVWIGGAQGSFELTAAQVEAERTGLTGATRFVYTNPQPASYLGAADIFVLTSREDSFPLACLEAAALGKPIICFERAGGMPEFVEEDCGFVVPYLDVTAMAERVARLVDCPACREKMGAAARRKVTERHDVSVAAPRILEIIEETIRNAPR